MKPMRTRSLGDRGIVIEFDENPSRSLTSFLAGLAEAAREIEGVVDAVPGHRTLLVETIPDFQKKAMDRIRAIAIDVTRVEGALHSLPAVYDGPDLDWVCKHANMTREQLIRLHSEPTYDVHIIGSPGFIYLSEVTPEIAAPRLDTPRGSVPQGSVGIGGRQTGIYGRGRPGGWRLIANVDSIPEVRPGDRVQFVPR